MNSYIANPVFDPVAKPGALFDWYRGNPQRQGIVEAFGELEPIRSVVTRPAAELIATTNRDGHRIVEVVEDGCAVARIHHDGQVVATRVAA